MEIKELTEQQKGIENELIYILDCLKSMLEKETIWEINKEGLFLKILELRKLSQDYANDFREVFLRCKFLNIKINFLGKKKELNDVLSKLLVEREIKTETELFKYINAKYIGYISALKENGN
jgi:hypothetical protein